MSFITDIPIKRSIPNNKDTFRKYEVNGSTQHRSGVSFIENFYTAKVTYEEDFQPTLKKVKYKIEDLEQSCKGLIFQFAENFNHLTSDLELKVNEGYEVESILNHPEIVKKWILEKETLREKFKTIPNIDELLNNYEKSIANEEKLRNSIFYSGIAQLFFPRIKQLLELPIESKKFLRKRNLHGFYFGIEIPIREELEIRVISNNNFVATINGSLDIEKIENKEEFLKGFKLLYGDDVEIENITFHAKERYELTPELEYLNGEFEQYFEVKGTHFKKDSISYKYIQDE